MNDLPLYFETYGTGQPLILLHGFTGSSANWAEHVPILAEQYQVITIDIVGHGRSPSPTALEAYKMEQVATDVVAVVRETAVAPITLLGYSMGGRLALYIAIRYPDLVKSLILESTSPGLADASEREARRRRDDALADWIEANGIEAFVNRWEKLSLWDSQQQLPAEKRHRLRQQRLNNNPIGLANSLRGMGTGVQPSLWNQLATLTTHTQLITGALDTKFVTISTKMATRLPHAQHKIIQAAGHTVHVEQPIHFQKLLLEIC
ncbi:MAG: 2-succinyl-6-hydroxy-2,4-cyclohexadiene-1-carboxylate synthase, partial [Chloroflexi bacterium]|nr:2-succinyl-6-hydroxy-2,4-cyclohexadiene-1-carboxylate synthase [Chloroflexota bacterium]